MPTSPATDPRRGPTAGFTLVELLLALAVLALIAGLALPRVMPNGTRTAVRIKALEIAALLRTDRNAAERSGQAVLTTVDLARRRVLSGSSAAAVDLPGEFQVALTGGSIAGFTFDPAGTSSGGELAIGARGLLLAVAVNPVTAAVDVSAR